MSYHTTNDGFLNDGFVFCERIFLWIEIKVLSVDECYCLQIVINHGYKQHKNGANLNQVHIINLN